MIDSCPECKRDLPVTTARFARSNGVIQECQTCQKRIADEAKTTPQAGAQ